MFAIDTNLLVYAHNTDSEFHEQASKFVTQVINERDSTGQHMICLSAQVVMEFLHVITWQRVEKPLSISQAIRVIRDYTDAGVEVIHHKETQVQTFLELLESGTTRRKTFDVALAATLKDNNISRLYTVNVSDFDSFDFLTVINPLQSTSAQTESSDSETENMSESDLADTQDADKK